MFQSLNPATEELLETFESCSRAAAAIRLDKAEQAWEQWRATPVSERAQILRVVAQLLRADQERYAQLMTAEMGKPIRQARAEVEKCALVCDFYAERGAAFLQPEKVTTEASLSEVRYEPLGLVLAIMPWNFPFWQVFRCAVPALLAGNGVLLKHAPNVCGAAFAIEQIFAQAGLPDSLFTVLLLEHQDIEIVLQHPAVQAVSLTGSERAGAQVAAAAGREIKKCVLELGGSDPFIVLADADLPHAALQAAKARCQNAGQSCIAAKRFILEAPIAEMFTQEVTRQLALLQVGDPRKEACDVGPLARLDLLTTLHDQVKRSIAQGARLMLGGKRLPGKGFFYPPTVLTELTPDMAVFAEETFGPVAALTTVNSAEEAVELANRSNYGLGASVWTTNIERGMQVAANLQAGNVFINEIVKSDPRLPFGGIKRSGYGRELAQFGLHEFVNVKTVWAR